MLRMRFLGADVLGGDLAYREGPISWSESGDESPHAPQADRALESILYLVILSHSSTPA